MVVNSTLDDYFATLTKKWSEVPGGSDRSGRHLSTELLNMTDDALLAFWDGQMVRAAEVRDWYHRLYKSIFPGRRVLEIGSGLGFDGITFLAKGVDWTFCDIVPENLEVIQRVVQLKGLSASFCHLSSSSAFDALPRNFDFVWCDGSMINVPFEIAAEESRLIMAHLKPGGRWIELAYPRERWLREGSQPCETWGNTTDGEGTPWMEWYDLQRIRERLLPYRFIPILDYRFSSDNFVWFDLEFSGQQHSRERRTLTIDAPAEKIETPPILWNSAWSVPIPDDSTKAPVRARVQCMVVKGSVGFAFELAGQHVSREIMVDAREASQVVHVDLDVLEPGTIFSLRNCSAGGPSEVFIESLQLIPVI